MRTVLAVASILLAAPALAQDRPAGTPTESTGGAVASDRAPAGPATPARPQPRRATPPAFATPAFSRGIGDPATPPASGRDVFGQTATPTRAPAASSPYGGYGTIQAPWAPR